MESNTGLEAPERCAEAEIEQAMVAGVDHPDAFLTVGPVCRKFFIRAPSDFVSRKT
jgi:hypothetical protein